MLKRISKYKIYRKDELPELYHSYHAYKTDGFEYYLVDDERSLLIEGQNTLDECINGLVTYLTAEFIQQTIRTEDEKNENETIEKIQKVFNLSKEEATSQYWMWKG